MARVRAMVNESGTKCMRRGGAAQFQHSEELRARKSSRFRDRLAFARDAGCATRRLALSLFYALFMSFPVCRVQCGSTNQNALLMQIAVVPRSLGANSQSATGNNHNDQ